MKVDTVDFLGSFPNVNSLKVRRLPSIAFIGRSNVGKSSFINHLLNRKGLAKTSATPGKTRLLNFFEINQKLHFVDLPGYGFAKVPVSVKEDWVQMTTEFLWNYEPLKVIVQLVDIRHKPSKEDLEFNAILKHANANLMVVGNKSDKIKKNQLTNRLESIRKDLSLESLPIHHSITDGKSRGALWSVFNSQITL